MLGLMESIKFHKRWTTRHILCCSICKICSLTNGVGGMLGKFGIHMTTRFVFCK